jgi:DNA helicase-2/ATP-dependent DNA helicase PcrA
LEFPVVFIVGVEEGLFPGNQVMYDPTEIEEERRLCYVGITRAKEKLYITNARSRMIYGNTNLTRPSRFILEIPEELTESNLKEPQQSSYGGFSSSSARGSYYGGSRTYGSSSTDSPTSRYSGGNSNTKASGGFSRGGFSGAPSKAEASASSVNFAVGDRVEHKTFGQGLIISAKAVGGDMILEIAFDDVGTKKIMAKMAKLKKI